MYTTLKDQKAAGGDEPENYKVKENGVLSYLFEKIIIDLPRAEFSKRASVYVSASC